MGWVSIAGACSPAVPRCARCRVQAGPRHPSQRRDPHCPHCWAGSHRERAARPPPPGGPRHRLLSPLLCVQGGAWGLEPYHLSSPARLRMHHHLGQYSGSCEMQTRPQGLQAQRWRGLGSYWLLQLCLPLGLVAPSHLGGCSARASPLPEGSVQRQLGRMTGAQTQHTYTHTHHNAVADAPMHTGARAQTGGCRGVRRHIT